MSQFPANEIVNFHSHNNNNNDVTTNPRNLNIKSERDGLEDVS